MTNHQRRAYGRMIEQPLCRRSEIGSLAVGGPRLQPDEHLLDRCLDPAGIGHAHTQRLSIQRVELRHRRGQRLRDAGRQPRQLRDRHSVESREERRTWSEVHDHEGSAQPIIWAARGADDWRRVAHGGNVGLNQRFLARESGVGHHPCHQLTVPTVRSAAQSECEQVRPEPTVQPDRLTIERERWHPSLSLQHGQQPLAQLVVPHSYVIYRNGCVRYCPCEW